jgi:arsenite methyltransferase
MTATIRYDREPARRILALSDTAEMRAQRTRVIELLAPQPGWRVLDVGCGPGHLVSDLADAVGGRSRVQGADVSEHMIALGAQRNLDLVQLSGTALPFDDASFDAVVATQAYEFVERLPAALGELSRVLRPGGRALILDTDWDTLVWHSSDPARMRRVLDGWRKRVAHPYLPRTLGRQLRDAGLDVSDCEAYAVVDRHGYEGSYSAQRPPDLAPGCERGGCSRLRDRGLGR